MKRIFALLLVLYLIAGVTACAAKQDNTPANEDSATDPEKQEDPKTGEDDKKEDPKATAVFSGENKVIDIYLIAGQSNAVGHTKITDTKAAYGFASELKKGFTNVLFSGMTRWDNVDGSGQYFSHDYRWIKTTLGLGKGDDSEYMGPEAGMAKALSEYYNKESGKTAGMIKYGHGGTSLWKTDGSNQFGNWASPTFAEKELGLGSASYNSSSVHGVLYREFLSVIRQKLKALVAEGYTNVNIKGLYWMQGENDRAEPDRYKTAFAYFASDIRRDVAEIVKELTGGDDRGAANMPIVAGTISQTQNLNYESDEAVNIKFIEMQKALPETVANCYVVDNSQYAISKYYQNGMPQVLGSDQWHWNQADHLEIGYNVGKTFLELLK